MPVLQRRRRAGAPTQRVPGGGAWAEVKTLAIGTLRPGPTPATPPHCTGRASCARLADAETFALLARGAPHRRGLPTAGAVVAVPDGSAWLHGCLA